jgi:hypothetical protein
VGSSLKLCGGYIDTNHSLLVYAEFFGECLNYFSGLTSLECIKAHIPPTALRDFCFSGCSNLKYIGDFLSQIITIPEHCFRNCTVITEISFPVATGVSGNGMISYCNNLRKFSAPILTEIKQWDFSGCPSLRTLEVAESCNLNGNTFSDCLLLTKPN